MDQSSSCMLHPGSTSRMNQTDYFQYMSTSDMGIFPLCAKCVKGQLWTMSKPDPLDIA